jgi:hypothetical protein
MLLDRAIETEIDNPSLGLEGQKLNRYRKALLDHQDILARAHEELLGLQFKRDSLQAATKYKPNN